MNGQDRMKLIQQAKSLPELAQVLGEHMDDWSVRYFLDMRAREKSVPLKGTFELTPLCNLDCQMCYVHLNSRQLQGRQPLNGDAWEKIMAQAVEAGMMYACLTGGECLIYPEFERLYLFLHEKGVQVSVLTNAVALGKERIAFFIKHPPASVQATLYGSDEEMYERITGKRLFTQVLNNLKAADQAGLPLTLTLTPSSQLGQEAEQLVRFAAALGLPFHINSGLITPRKETGRQERDVDVDAYMGLFLLERELKGHARPQVVCEQLPAPGGESELQQKGLRCGGGRSAFVVCWDGTLVPCNRLQEIAGFPLEEGFHPAWKKINRLAEDFLLPMECEGCVYRLAAKPCAAAHRQAASGHRDKSQCLWCQAMVKVGFAKLITSHH